MKEERFLIKEVKLMPEENIYLDSQFVAELFSDGSTDLIGESYDPIEGEKTPVRKTYPSTHFCKYKIVKRDKKDETTVEVFLDIKEAKDNFKKLNEKDKINHFVVAVIYDSEEDVIDEVDLVI